MIAVTALKIPPYVKLPRIQESKYLVMLKYLSFAVLFLVPRKFSVTCYHTGRKMEMKAHDISNKFITLNTFLLRSTFYVILCTLICGHWFSAMG